MSNREYYGKEEEKEHEKQEKEHEKEEEKVGGGPWGHEKWRRDPLSAIVWAAILIWAGVALLAGNLGLLQNIGFGDRRLDGGSLVFIGAAGILALEIAVRLLIPTYRRPVGGTLILAAILLGVGLGGLFGWEVIGPLVLIAVGLSILLRGFLRGGGGSGE